MSRILAPVVLALLLAAGPAWGLRATPHLDALEAELAARAAALVGATDKTAKKQRKAAEKALARIAVDTETLADDLNLAKKIAGPIEKAYRDDVAMLALLDAAADAFEIAVDSGADLLERARQPLPDAKLTKKADRLLAKAEKLRDKAARQTRRKKRLSLLFNAQKAADKAADVLADALGDPVPTRLVLTPDSALFTGAGERRTFSVRVLDQLDRPIAAPVSWSSTDVSVASVDAAGAVTGGAVGSAQIVASAGALEARAVVVSARPAAGAIPVPDSAVVGPLLATDPEHFGIGAEYTAVLRGDAPAVGALVYGTGELPLGGEVVAVEPLGGDWLVTLAIVPLDVLFAELEIRETITLTDEQAEVPEDIAELFDAELQEDGTWVFHEREGVDVTAPRHARGAAQGTVAQQGPFECKAAVPFPISLAAGLSLQLQQSFAIDLEYGTAQGLERLVLEGQITATAAFKPRVTAQISASVECKAELLKLNYPLPPPLSLVFGAQIPVGIGFKIDGSIQAAQLGFDAVAQFQSTTSAGVQCSGGACEPVTTSTNTSTATFAWVTPDPSTQFTVTAAARGFGYAELCMGNPLWNVLQLCMLEAQGGVEQTVAWSPTTVQLNNTTAASNYKLLLYFLIGAKAELMNVLEFFNVSLASLQYRADFELARSPEGSFTFEGPVALGDTVRATLQLTNVDYLGVENVQDVRFYRRDSSLSLIEKAVVPRTSAGQTTYVAEWPATSGDLGAELGAVTLTEILPLEFEVAPNSLQTLGGQTGEVTACTYDLWVDVWPDNTEGFEDRTAGTCSQNPTPSVSASAGGATAAASLQSDVVVDSDGRLERVEWSGAAEAGGADVFRAHVNKNIFTIDFVLGESTPYTLTASTQGASPQSFNWAWILLRTLDHETIACAADGWEGPCPGGSASVSAEGELPPGSYRLEAHIRIQEHGLASYSGTLTLGD